MKKIILLVITALMMVGCSNQPETIDTKEGFNIVNIDSCEYLKCYTYGFGAYVYTHKGNCRFCKERRQKELKELIEQLKKE